MKIIKEDTVQIRMLPVCECGYVFRDGIVIYRNIREATNGIKFVEHLIQPNICPNCRKIIDCIEDSGATIEIKEGF